MARRPEDILGDKVRDFLQSERNRTKGSLMFYKVHGSSVQAKGMPDFDVVYLSVPFKIELKAGKGEPSKIQVARIDQWRMSGAVSGCLYSVGEVAGVIDMARTVSGTGKIDYINSIIDLWRGKNGPS